MFSSHRERLKRMVQINLDRRLAARFDASDVVQETLLDASRRIHEFVRDPAVPVYVWLRQIARDRMADLYERHLTTQKRSVLREQSWGLSQDSLDQIATQVAAHEPSPSGRAMARELRDDVHRALAAMPEPERDILIMRHLEQMSLVEIAARYGISEGAVKMRRLRAIRHLRSALQRRGAGSSPSRDAE